MNLFLDVETTGLEVKEGHRVVELGLVREDGNQRQWYFNPERDMMAQSVKIHGLTRDFLQDKPIFKDKVKEILDFIGDCKLVAHHVQFDISFLNNELGRINYEPLSNSKEDTLALARRRFPSEKRYNLNSLCKKFGIDVSMRQKHGALMDAQLLARLYPHLISAVLEQVEMSAVILTQGEMGKVNFKRRYFLPTVQESAIHKEFVSKFVKNSLWN